MADIYLGFGEDDRPVHHTKSVRSEINLDYGESFAGSRPPLVGVEVLGVDRLSIDGKDLDHLLDKERLAAKLQVLGESLGLINSCPPRQAYTQDAMMLAERLLGEW